MLVSAQTFLVNYAKSDPPIHEGPAYVGDLWVEELDTTSTLQDVDNVGIGHAAAMDQYVTWTKGEGEIIANWTVNIQSNHPDYCVIFSLSAYNVDDNNSEIDSAYDVLDYSADTQYSDGGQLTLNIQFDQNFLENNVEATVVCYLTTAITINNTDEAKNFTSVGDDRCVVGIVLDGGTSEQPYARFITDANDNFPNMWSWQLGWDQNDRYSDESDMLETQTFFYVSGEQSKEPSDWQIGQFDIKIDRGHYEADFTPMGWVKEIQFAPYNVQRVYPYIALDYHYNGGQISLNKLTLWHENLPSHGTSGIVQPPNEEMGKNFTLHKSDDLNSNHYIWFAGWAWSWGVGGHSTVKLLRNVHYSDDTGSLQSSNYSENGYYWEGSCGYYNTTSGLEVDSSTNNGVTTVDCNISPVLLEDEQYVYAYAADVGNTQIKLTC